MAEEILATNVKRFVEVDQRQIGKIPLAQETTILYRITAGRAVRSFFHDCLKGKDPVVDVFEQGGERMLD